MSDRAKNRKRRKRKSFAILKHPVHDIFEYNEENNVLYQDNESSSHDSNAEGNTMPFMDLTFPPEKYFSQRYRLFSKYSHGIQLDYESWFSVTPEKIAKHIAQRFWRKDSNPQHNMLESSSLQSHVRPNDTSYSQYNTENLDEWYAGIVLDAFCGAGGNAIQFALEAPPSSIVFAIDVDPVKIQMAKNNAIVYQAEDRIEFILGDSVKLAPHFRVDSVFLSPPWGGPGYIDQEEYDLDSLFPVSGSELVTMTRRITPNFAMLLPKISKLHQIVSLVPPGESVEIETNYINNRSKTITAYFGGLINQNPYFPATDVYTPSDILPVSESLDPDEIIDV